MNRKQVSRIAGLAVSVAIGIAAAVAAGPANDTLRVAFPETVDNLDYNYAIRRENLILSDLTDEGLFVYDPKTRDFAPSVASGYTYSDPLTIDVALRSGVTFHDGTPLDADAVVYTYNWIIDPKSGARARKAVSRWLAKAEKIDRQTVRFHLKSDSPHILYDMARRVRLRKKDSYLVAGKADRNAMAKAPVGLGPYRVVSFDPGRKIVLERYDGFFAESPKNPVEIKNIVVRFLPDGNAQRNELRKGALDLIIDMTGKNAADFAKLPNVKRISGPDLKIGFLVLDAVGNTDRNGPLTNLLVRRAINFAINRADIAKFGFGGASVALHTPCHPAQFGCAQDVTEYPYDPGKARKLLAAAGYPDGFAFELMSYHKRSVAKAIAADLDAVGIRVDLNNVDVATLQAARDDHAVQAYFGAWGSYGIPDVSAILPMYFSTDSARNMSGDALLARTILAAGATSDRKKQKKLYRRALATIADQAYWVPLATYSRNYVAASDLSFPLTADGLPRLYQTSWK